jgi:hypothetical protein
MLFSFGTGKAVRAVRLPKHITDATPGSPDVAAAMLEVGRKLAHRLKRQHDTDKTVRASRYEYGAPQPDREDTSGTHLGSRLRRVPRLTSF